MRDETEYAQTRARRIVALAARKVTNAQAKSWLRCDERGTWEKTALEWWEKTAETRKEKSISDSVAENEIADRLVLLALQALIQHGTKKERRKET